MSISKHNTCRRDCGADCHFERRGRQRERAQLDDELVPGGLSTQFSLTRTSPRSVEVDGAKDVSASPR